MSTISILGNTFGQSLSSDFQTGGTLCFQSCVSAHAGNLKVSYFNIHNIIIIIMIWLRPLIKQVTKHIIMMHVLFSQTVDICSTIDVLYSR